MRLPTPSSSREDGFTVVEMIVVAILLLIVLTMTMRFLLDILQREQEGVVGKRSNERAMVAMDQLGQDIRAAVSRERASGGGLGLDDLDFVASGYLPAGAERDSFVQEKLDIIAASPWRLQMMVPSGATTQCVEYRTSAAERGRLTRTVSSSCPAQASNTVSRSIVVEAAPVGTTPPPPFTYTQLNADATCSTSVVAAGASFDALSGSGDMRTLYRISSVRVDLRSHAAAGGNRATTRLSTEYVVRSRMSAPYRRAVGGGCAE